MSLRVSILFKMIKKSLDNHPQHREKLQTQGPQALSDTDLLAIILGRGTRDKNVTLLARDIIELLKNEAGHARPSLGVDVSADLNRLLQIKGIGTAKACQILASLELSRRFILNSNQVTINHPVDALPCIAFLKQKRREEFLILTLDSANHLINTHQVTSGLVNQSPVHAREVFYHAIQDNAVSIMLAHNHPSGSLHPSPADLKTTQQLVRASQTMGIPVLDHLIISNQGYLSIREQCPGYFV